MTPNYPHQDYEIKNFGRAPKRALFWSPRTGKTRAAIQSALEARVYDLLVIAPLSTCPQWATALEEHGLPVVRGYAMNRGPLLAALRKRTGVVVLSWRRISAKNPEDRKRGRPSSIAERLLACNFTGIICDESHNMASPSADQARLARRLCWQAPWVRLLTGTPAANHYGSLWGQLSALDKDAFGGSYEKFAQRYLVRDTMFPSRVLGHLPTVENELRPKMLPYISIVRRDDVFGPDKYEENVRIVDLPPNAIRIYRTLATKWLIDDLLQVDATQILKRLVRLQQVAAGFVKDDDGFIHNLHTAKIDAVTEDLAKITESDEKAVVFHRFRWEGEQLIKRAKTLGVPVYEINGDTPVAERSICLSEMAKPGAKIAVVQTKSGGVGISFAEVPYQLVLSQSFSFTDEEQAHDRTYKPHTARFVTYYRTSGTVDEFIASVLKSKQSLRTAVTRADLEAMAFGTIKKMRMK
jgi:SNF2 family DNA or RNA helicase